MISQDHVVEGSRGLMVQGPLKVSYHPAKFGGHKGSGSGDMFLVCPMIFT